MYASVRLKHMAIDTGIFGRRVGLWALLVLPCVLLMLWTLRNRPDRPNVAERPSDGGSIQERPTLASAGEAVPVRGVAVVPAGETRPGELPVMFGVPAFAGVDQAGRPVSNETLAGRVWVANFIFTRCTTACPMMTSRMVLLQRELPGVDVQFVSFSVDQPFDTPAVLAEYARLWAAEEARWRLVSLGTSAAIEAMTRSLHVPIERSDDANNPIFHSELFFLIDGVGQVRSIYNTKVDEAMARLPGDVRKLLGTPPPAVAASAHDGAALYESLGCAACHNNAKLAPSLSGILGTQVALADGTTATVDDTYLRESIVDPTRKLAKGYLAMMPSYRPHLSEPQLDALVAHVKSLASQQAAGPRAVVGIHIDPVCRMEVRGAADSIQATVDGKTYYFCCPDCRDDFVANPKSFLTGAATRPSGH
jgi:protein SCO1/2